MNSLKDAPPSKSAINSTPVLLALILFLSGFCALIYQTVWLREFRLVFGGAAPAASAVVAVFMAGLGFGGRVFGAWVERVSRPFRFYARLEAGIAIAAALSLSMLAAARALYLKTGGTAGMGLGAATCLQLVMTVLVLGLPCFLMGGALPAAMKFAQKDDDPRRSITAFFYGINIAGAVTGAMFSTFWLLPGMGNRSTLFLAVVVNLCIALLAGIISVLNEKRALPKAAEPAGRSASGAAVEARAPATFVLAAAFVSGLSFFVAELIWFRVSTPLLGGSVYGFGLVLGVVLAGMGAGGLLYSWILKKAEPGLGGFTLVSALQALAVLLPYALGDRIAHLALILNDSLRGVGLAEMAAGWAVIMGLLAFLPSLLSGIQFPLLVSLLGRGNARVGQQLGRAYLWNTLGSITGSLLGGFVLVPVLGLKGCWLLVAGVIAMMSAVSLVLQARRGNRDAVPFSWHGRLAGAALALGILCAVISTGPTATWLHTAVGYGRVTQDFRTALGLETWKRTTQRSLVQAYDGRDTSVAVMGGSQYAFLTNGKSDGTAVEDAPTQVMLGITGAILHPAPRTACVVGLGTGTTAGWLADVPGIDRVDVLELEEQIRKIAVFFDPVSRQAMQNPRVRNITGDAREFLLTKGANYDLIVSEPSNPCRAGVANLYTREFYASASRRLNEGGIFCQWLQGYEVEPATITTVIATLRQVFPKVEVWGTIATDLLLVCSNEDTPWSLDSIRRRVKVEPMAEALRRFWKTDTAEGFLAGCLAGSSYCTALASATDSVNTDDLNRLEFSFARIVKSSANCSFDLARAATRAGCFLPLLDAPVDRDLYMAERTHLPGRLWEVAAADVLPAGTPGPALAHVQALGLFWNRRYAEFLTAPAPALPVLADRIIRAQAAAHAGAADAMAAIDAISHTLPGEASFLRALASHVQKKPADVLRHIEDGLDTLLREPWCRTTNVIEVLNLLPVLAATEKLAGDPHYAVIFDKLGRDYPVGILREARLRLRCEMADHLGLDRQLAALQSLGQPFPWTPSVLAIRVNAYTRAGDPRLGAALDDLARFLDQGGRLGVEPPPFTIPRPARQPAPGAPSAASPLAVGARPPE